MSCPNCAKATAAVEEMRGALEACTSALYNGYLEEKSEKRRGLFSKAFLKAQAALAQHPAGGGDGQA